MNEFRELTADELMATEGGTTSGTSSPVALIILLLVLVAFFSNGESGRGEGGFPMPRVRSFLDVLINLILAS